MATSACSLAKAGTHEQHGWPSTGYGISKAGIILLTRIQQANIDKDPNRQDIVINAVSWSLTRLTFLNLLVDLWL
jgi:hypothetical protein